MARTVPPRNPRAWQKFIVSRFNDLHSPEDITLMLRSLYKRYKVDPQEVSHFLRHLVKSVEEAKAGVLPNE